MRRRLVLSILTIFAPLLIVFLISFDANAAVTLAPELEGCRPYINASYTKIKSFSEEFNIESLAQKSPNRSTAENNRRHLTWQKFRQLSSSELAFLIEINKRGNCAEVQIFFENLEQSLTDLINS